MKNDNDDFGNESISNNTFVKVESKFLQSNVTKSETQSQRKQGNQLEKKKKVGKRFWFWSCDRKNTQKKGRRRREKSVTAQKNGL